MFDLEDQFFGDTKKEEFTPEQQAKFKGDLVSLVAVSDLAGQASSTILRSPSPRFALFVPVAFSHVRRFAEPSQQPTASQDVSASAHADRGGAKSGNDCDQL